MEIIVALLLCIMSPTKSHDLLSASLYLELPFYVISFTFRLISCATQSIFDECSDSLIVNKESEVCLSHTIKRELKLLAEIVLVNLYHTRSISSLTSQTPKTVFPNRIYS